VFAWVRRSGNRRLVIGCLAVAALLGGLAAVRQFWPVGPGVSPANFRKITLGMPESEVEQLLGGPPVHSDTIEPSGDIPTYKRLFPDWQRPHVPPDPPYPVCRVWAGNQCSIQIIFNEQGRVVARRYDQDSYVTTARQWLADQWSKTPPGRKAQIERDLRSCPSFADDPKLTLGDLLDHLHDRYDIEFRFDPADFGLRDAEELRQQPVGLQENADGNPAANVGELLARVKATYVIEDGYVRIVPAPPKE
jgi:hypothetical protein